MIEHPSERADLEYVMKSQEALRANKSGVCTSSQRADSGGR
jgi:hypothetical protein